MGRKYGFSFSWKRALGISAAMPRPSSVRVIVGNLLLASLLLGPARSYGNAGAKSDRGPLPWETGRAPLQGVASGLPSMWPAFHDKINPAGETPPLWRSAPPVSGDELWWDGFGLPIVDGIVYSIVEYQGSIVVGGQFRHVGGIQATNIARWDGTSWSGLGDGIDGLVSALAVFQGGLVAGGSFRTAGGIPVQSIARWDGQTWTAMGQGLLRDSYPGYVATLVKYGDDLIAGGDFASAGSTPARSIARWNGADWDSMGAGLDGLVTSIVVNTDMLYAGGAFTNSGGTPASKIARWDGAAWNEVGGGVQLNSIYGGDYGRVTGLASYRDHLIVAGYFDQAGDSTVSNIAEWDGSQWSDMNYWGSTLTALAVSQDALFLSGWQYGLQSWDGTLWTTRPGLQGHALAMASVGPDLLIGGYIQAFDSTGTFAPSIARYSGGSWHELATWDDKMRGIAGDYGRPGQAMALASYKGRVIAGGSFWYPVDPPAWARSEGLAAWDGTGWSEFPPIPTAGYYGSVSTLLSVGDALYAGGSFFSYDTTYQVRPVYRFADNQWTPLGASNFFPNALTYYGGSLFAAGRDVGFSDSTAGVYQWTGASWHKVGTVKGQFPSINSLAVLNGRLVIAGRFSSVDGVQASNLAEWDASHWGPFGSPPPYSSYEGISAMVHDGKLVVTGSLGLVLRWTGSSWEIMGSLQASGAVVASVGGELFVGGYLRWPADPYRYFGVARWEGHDWVELGSGTNGPARTFLSHNGSVYMSGGFSRAGNKSSFGIARWTGMSGSPSAPALSLAAPNPFHSVTQFSYRVTASGSVRISVFDLRGREIAVLERGSRAAGSYTATWNGRDRNGVEVAAGVYFIRADLPGGAELSGKVVRIR